MVFIFLSNNLKIINSPQLNSSWSSFTSTHVCSVVSASATPWTVAGLAPLSMGFFRQEYWSGLPCSPPGDLPDPGIEFTSPASPALAHRFSTTEPPGKPHKHETAFLNLCVYLFWPVPCFYCSHSPRTMSGTEAWGHVGGTWAQESPVRACEPITILG